MFVLITGANGFVGKNLIKKLESDNIGYIKFAGDITKPENVLEYAKYDFDAIIHLAAKITGSDSLIEKVNIEGTENIIDLAKQKNINKIVFVSSIRVLSENSDPYRDSKIEAEKMIREANINYSIIRPSLIYGPGDKKNIGLIIGIIKKLKIAPVFGFKMQPIYIYNVVEIIAKVLGEEENKIYNIVGKEIIEYDDLIDLIKKYYPKFLKLNFPSIFNNLLRIISLLPFSGFTHWQTKKLLASEIYEGDDWENIFKVEAINLEEGIKKMIYYKI